MTKKSAFGFLKRGSYKWVLTVLARKTSELTDLKGASEVGIQLFFGLMTIQILLIKTIRTRNVTGIFASHIETA